MSKNNKATGAGGPPPAISSTNGQATPAGNPGSHIPQGSRSWGQGK